MNLSFLNPFFLIGLAAVAFPIIAHLISRKSGIKKSFPAVRFLLSSQGQVAKRSKIKDLILLLFRSLILVLLVLVFAKPAVFSFSAVDVQDVKSVAIVVDNSFSMGYGDNFKNAKSKAEKLIESLADGSFAAVFPLVQNESTKPEITQDKREMIEDLKKLKLSYTFTDNERRLEEIFDFLQRAPNRKKEVILFTDFQKNGWKEEHFQREWLLPIDVTRDQEIKNHAVSQIDFKGQGDSVKISVKVSNYSKIPVKDLLAAVFLGDKEIKGFFDIKAGEEQIKEFIFPVRAIPDEFIGDRSPLQRGETLGRVEISHDNLPVDDVRYFVLSRTEKPRILVVDGDPREEARLSETYYIARAVETISELLPLSLSIKDNDSFLDEKLERYNLILLANVGDITPQKAREVEEFLKDGGAVVIFLGDRVRSGVYNTLFRNVLPADIGTISEGDYSLSTQELNEFIGEINEKFSQAEIKRLFNLRPNKDSYVILDASSIPFLIKGNVGKGSIFLFGSTADTSWNSFPLTPVFLPTIKKIFDLSFSTESKRGNFIVGEPVKIEFPKELNEITVRTPSGEEFKVYKENPEFSQTLIPGIYTVKEDEKVSYNFSVNIDPRESNLEKISLKTASPRSGTESGLVKVFKEIWSYFLWGVIALFVSESVFRVLYAK